LNSSRCSIDFFFVFRTAGPDIVPSQTYDYESLNSFAQLSQQSQTKKDSKEVEQESETKNDSEAEHEAEQERELEGELEEELEEECEGEPEGQREGEHAKSTGGFESHNLDSEEPHRQ
jgi:hypothetical protein